jgi:hypothetical protein
MADTILDAALETEAEMVAIIANLEDALAGLRAAKHRGLGDDAPNRPGRHVPPDYYYHSPHIPPWALNPVTGGTFRGPDTGGDD